MEYRDYTTSHFLNPCIVGWSRSAKPEADRKAKHSCTKPIFRARLCFASNHRLCPPTLFGLCGDGPVTLAPSSTATFHLANPPKGVGRFRAGEGERTSIMVGSRKSLVPDSLVGSGRALPLCNTSPQISTFFDFQIFPLFFSVIYRHPLYFHPLMAITSASMSARSRHQRSISSKVSQKLTNIDLYKNPFPRLPTSPVIDKTFLTGQDNSASERPSTSDIPVQSDAVISKVAT